MTFMAVDLAATTSSDANQIQTIASRLRKHLQNIAERRIIAGGHSGRALGSGC